MIHRRRREPKMTNRYRSISDFKDWFSDQKGMSDFFNFQADPNEKYIGNAVKPKVSEGKLLERIECDDDAEQLVAEFKSDGGTVVAIEGKRVHVEVDSGEFFIPRFCVKIKKPTT
jgi:hypothetical protein